MTRKISKVFVWSVAVLLFCAAPASAQDFTHPTTGTTNFSVTGTHNYYDSGGADCDPNGEYAASEDGVAVICPATAGEYVTIEFLDVDVETSTSSRPLSLCSAEGLR